MISIIRKTTLRILVTIFLVSAFSFTVRAEMLNYRVTAVDAEMLVLGTGETVIVPEGKPIILQRVLTDKTAEVSYLQYRGLMERSKIKAEKRYVSATTLNLRDEPNTTTSTILAEMQVGSLVTVLSKDTETQWYRVQYGNTVGYCSANYLSTEKVIGAFVTPLLGNENNRSNIRLAAASVSGIVPKGTQFSYLQRIGKTTPERGYKKAGVIQGGKIVEGYGGGVCQVSSTLCGALLTMPTKEDVLVQINHTPHSLPSAYIAREYEATVADPYIDFTFTLSRDVKIEAYTDDSYLYIKVIDNEGV